MMQIPVYSLTGVQKNANLPSTYYIFSVNDVLKEMQSISHVQYIGYIKVPNKYNACIENYRRVVFIHKETQELNSLLSGDFRDVDTYNKSFSKKPIGTFCPFKFYS